MRYQLSNPELAFNLVSSQPVNFQQLGAEEIVRVYPPQPIEPPPMPEEPTADEQLASDVCSFPASATQKDLDRLWTRIFTSEAGPAGIRDMMREDCGKVKLPPRFTPCPPGEVRQRDPDTKEYICGPPKPPSWMWCPPGQEAFYRGGRWKCETPVERPSRLPRRGPEVQRPGTCPPGYIRRPVPPYDCLPPVATGERTRTLPPPIALPPQRTPTQSPLVTPTPTGAPPTSMPTSGGGLIPTATEGGLPSMPFGLPMESAPVVAPNMSGSGFLGQVPLVRRP